MTFPKELPIPEDGTGVSWMDMAESWSDQYFSCAITHNALVKVLRLE